MTAPLRTDLNEFLFASVANDANGMHLTMLSALARSGVDPWAEAADLAALSRESATKKLISLLAGVPNGPAPGADAASLASRLVGLLHAAPKPKASATATEAPRQLVTAPKPVRIALYSLLAVLALILANWAFSNPQAPNPVDPHVSTAR